jgi:hypothetical protein
MRDGATIATLRLSAERAPVEVLTDGPLAYAQARDLIRTGDLIGVRDVHGLLGRATVMFTRSPYTHTGVAVWLGDHLFMADLNSGRNHLTPLSQLTDFDVCSPPEGLDRASIEQAIIDWLSKPINYGFAAFVAIGIQEALDMKLFMHWRSIVVCSGGSVTIYELAAALMRSNNLTPPAAWVEHTRMISPGKLVAELPFKLAVRGAATV